MLNNMLFYAFVKSNSIKLTLTELAGYMFSFSHVFKMIFSFGSQSMNEFRPFCINSLRTGKQRKAIPIKKLLGR